MNQRGYTLVEILVVLIIVTTLSSLIIIRVGHFGAPPPARQLDHLATLLTGWCEQAVLQHRNLGVHIGSDGYDFREPDVDSANAGDTVVRWRQSRHELFTPRAWEGEVQPRLLVSGQMAELDLDIPQLRCYSSAQMTPFSLTLAVAGHSRQGASLQGDSNGHLRLLD